MNIFEILKDPRVKSLEKTYRKTFEVRGMLLAILEDCLTRKNPHIKYTDVNAIVGIHGFANLLVKESLVVKVDATTVRLSIGTWEIGPATDHATNGLDFEAIWTMYPKRYARDEAKKRFMESIKTEVEYNDLKTAIKNYEDHCKKQGVPYRYLMALFSFIGSYKDWVMPVSYEPNKTIQNNQSARTELTGAQKEAMQLNKELEDLKKRMF